MEFYLIFSSILPLPPPLGKGYRSVRRWKVASKKSNFFTSILWPLLLFLLINADILEYYTLYKEAEFHIERDRIFIIHQLSAPSLQVLSFTNNLKFAPETTLSTIALQSSRLSLLVVTPFTTTDAARRYPT